MLITKGDFVEIKYTGKVNEEIFDSNNEEDLKAIDPKSTPRKVIAIVGYGTVLTGLDKALEGKEIGKQYKIHVSSKEGFGHRKPELIRTIPLHVFESQNIKPQRGMTLMLDNNVVSIRSVSGARVITDFNNPLAGKELDYTFTIIRKVDDVKEKSEAFFVSFLHGVPELEIGEKVTLHGPKQIEGIITLFKANFKTLVGLELEFKAREPKEPGKEKVDARQDPQAQQSL